MYKIALVAASLLAPTTALAEVWNVDTDHTEVGFKVRHMMVSNVDGEFGDFSGTFETDKKGRLKAVKGTVQVASVDTDNKKRDDHLVSPDFFDSATFGVMSFVSTGVKTDGDGYDVTGDLTIRGVTKSVTFDMTTLAKPVVGPWGNTRSGTTMTSTINRQEFGVSWNQSMDAGGYVVGDDVHITLEVELIKATDAQAEK